MTAIYRNRPCHPTQWVKTLPPIVVVLLLMSMSLRVNAAEPDIKVEIPIALDDPEPQPVDVAARFADVLVFKVPSSYGVVKLELYPSDLSLRKRDEVCIIDRSSEGSFTIERGHVDTPTPCKRVLHDGITAYTVEYAYEKPVTTATGKKAPSKPQAIKAPARLTLEHEIQTAEDVVLEKREPNAHYAVADLLMAAKLSDGDGSIIFAADPTAPVYERKAIDGLANSQLEAQVSDRLKDQDGFEFYVYPPNHETRVIKVRFTTDEPPDSANLEPESVEGDGLAAACEKVELLGAKVEPKKGEPPVEPWYQVCIDVTVYQAPRVVVIESRLDKKGERQSERHTQTTTLVAGRAIFTRVYHRAEEHVVIEVAGENSVPSLIYLHPSLGGPKVGSDTTSPLVGRDKKTYYYDAPVAYRGDDGFVKVGVVVRSASGDPAKDPPLRSYQQAFRNVPSYIGAVRIGVGLTWAPWDKAYGVRAADDSMTNPGKELYIKDGGYPEGRISTEFVLGYSIYLPKDPVPATRRVPWPSWYFGAGLVNLAPDKVELLTSLHTGPEISFGHSVSLAAVVSVRRTSRLQRGYTPGDALPNSTTEPPVSSSVWPALQFGLVLNFSPRAFEIANKARNLGK